MNPPRPSSRRRWPWIFLGGFLVGGAVGVGLLLAPPVQGWLLRRLVATQSGWQLDFERIGLGPTGLDARGLAFAMPGVEASSAPVEIRVAPTRLFSKRELRIERVEARKIRLTLTPAQLAAAAPGAAPAAPFDGVLRLLQAPLPWALDAANLDGEIVVREAGESRLTGAFSLRGGGLSAATPGEFHYELSADSILLPPGPDHQLTSSGIVRLTQTPAHGVARLTVDGDLRLPRYGAFALPGARIFLDVAAAPAGETYTARLTFGSSAALTLDATLDASRSSLTGRVTLHADQSIAASLSGDRLPQATMDGALAFTLNLRNGDLDLALTGDLDVRAWEKILPQLALLDAFKGRIAAALTRRGEQLTLKNLTASLRGEHAPAEAKFVLTQACDLLKPPATPLGTLTLAHAPLEWANPFLAPAGLKIAPGEFSGEWTLSVDPATTLHLAPTRPATLGPILVSGGKLPSLPALNVVFSSRVDVSATRVALEIPDFVASTDSGDRLEAQLALSRDATRGELRTSGELHGSLPSLLADAGAPSPFTLNGRWAAALRGTQLHVSTLEFTALPPGRVEPLLEIALRQAFDFDVEKRTAPVSAAAVSTGVNTAAAPEWLRLRFAGFPLAWLSRWLSGNTVGGTFMAGESALRPTEGGFALHTSIPWRLDGFSFAAGKNEPVRIDAQFAPELTARGDAIAATFEELSLADAKGNHVSGRIGLTAALAEKNFTADVALDAALPALPHTAETFGPLAASLRAKFHNRSARIIGADEFALRVRHGGGELLALDAPLPFVFGLSDTDMVVVSTLAPLRIKLGGFPLTWLRPWSGELELTGTLAPAEFEFSSRINRYSVRPIGPVRAEQVSIRNGGRELFSEASVVLHPGLDLTFICVTQPKLQMAYTGSVHVTEAQLDVAGRHALDLDAALGFKGNETLTLPDVIDLSVRADFAALGMLKRGTLVTRINGDLLGAKPVELWLRLADLPAANALDSLAPLEVTLRGKLSRDNVFAGGVELLIAAAPRPTDAKFDVSLNLVGGGLNITSGFRSEFLDAAALMDLARAFTPATEKISEAPQKTIASPAATTRAPGDVTLPFWAELTGSFDLDLGTVQFAPYRIDRVRGRLDVDRQALVLHDLGGEMFAGRWGGGLRIEHDLGNTTGEHRLAGEFHIEQFESARVVQTVFPNQLASVDARINVRAKVESHGNSFVSLIDRSAAEFTVDGEKGLVRLTVPKADLVSTAAVFGGTVLLSPELRALGRLLKKFAEMPVDQLRITGRRAAGGEVSVDEFRFESPQVRLLGRGRIPIETDQPLMNRPLELSMQLAAKDELAVILGGMSLLEKKPRADGFRAMRQPFLLGGRAGAPDTAPLYDLLAKAVGGSSGTWGFLMRKVQAEVEKKKPSAPKPNP